MQQKPLCEGSSNDQLAAAHRRYLNRSVGYPRAATMGETMIEEPEDGKVSEALFAYLEQEIRKYEGGARDNLNDIGMVDTPKLIAEIRRLRQGIKDFLDGDYDDLRKHFSKLLEG